VITAAANAGMVKMLPEVLSEVRKLVGDRRVTVVFDRGGWSPKLFGKLLEANFDLLTYRKGKSRRVAEHRFVVRRAQFDSRTTEYRLHDQAVRLLKGKLRLRQVVRLSDDGHQTKVITSRWDLADIEFAYCMFERWRQENFFKYLREEFLLDALADYRWSPTTQPYPIPSHAHSTTTSATLGQRWPSWSRPTARRWQTALNNANRICAVSRSPQPDRKATSGRKGTPHRASHPPSNTPASGGSRRFQRRCRGQVGHRT